ncbi:MAG: hypothetical protein ABFS14_06085 [Gemmatimonadota bacterium]
MSANVYLIAHVVGITMVFMALGGAALHALNGGGKEDNRSRGLLAAFHGTGLLIMLVSGFAMLAKLSLDFSGWVVGKLVVWLLLGAALSIVLRNPQKARILWWSLPVLGGLAAWLAVTKPF